jgi:hypothetical protein
MKTPRGQEKAVRVVIPVNASERNWTDNSYILAFGTYGDILLYVWARSLEDVFDKCIDWIAENAPGLLCDDVVAEEYNRCRKLDPSLSEEECHEAATIDTTCGGDEGHYIHSSEWSIVCENPSRADILSLLGLPLYRDRKLDK